MLTALIPAEEPRRNVRWRPWVVIAATVVAVAVNTAAAALGAQSGQDRASTLVEPAGYAFGIWGVIFLANLVFAVYQSFPEQQEDAVLDRAAIPYVAGQVFATVFAVAALADAHLLSQASTVLYFAAAIATYVLLGVGVREDGWARRICAWLPASMSAAWLLAATIIVIAQVLVVDLEATSPFGTAEGWAAAALAVAALCTVALLIVRRDFAFAAVTAWALVAVGQQQDDAVVDAAVIASLAAIGLVALGMVPRTAASSWRTRPRRAGAHQQR